MRPSLSVWVQYLLPHRLLAWLIYHLSRCRWSGVKTPLIGWFVRHYEIDLAESDRTDPSSFESFNDFFTRKLRPGARMLAGDERTLLSPVDGFLTQFGTAIDGALIQAKGMTYRIEELVSEPRESIVGLGLGSYATLYLAPSHYHRVHLPLAGSLKRTRYIPGRRFSVNEQTALAIPRLFCRNERVVCWFDTAAGPLALVLVGAMNVSSIATQSLGEIASGEGREWHHDEGSQGVYGRGDEVGRFNLGSTVVVLLPAGQLTWDAGLEPGMSMKMGEALGELVGTAEPAS